MGKISDAENIEKRTMALIQILEPDKAQGQAKEIYDTMLIEVSRNFSEMGRHSCESRNPEKF